MIQCYIWVSDGAIQKKGASSDEEVMGRHEASRGEMRLISGNLVAAYNESGRWDNQGSIEAIQFSFGEKRPKLW